MATVAGVRPALLASLALIPQYRPEALTIDFIRDLIDGSEEWVLEFVTNVYEAIGWFGVIGLMAIESTAIPLPSEIVMPLAGWKLIEEKDLGFEFVLLAGLAGAAGSLLGSLIEYYVARAGGRPLVEKYGKFLLITHADLDRADRWFETRGELTVFIARFIPGVRGFISIPAGIARMNVLRFSIFTFLGAFPWTLGLAIGGWLLGANYDAIREVTRPFDIPVILGVMALVIWFVQHRVREIRAESRAVSVTASEPSVPETTGNE